VAARPPPGAGNASLGPLFELGLPCCPGRWSQLVGQWKAFCFHPGAQPVIVWNSGALVGLTQPGDLAGTMSVAAQCRSHLCLLACERKPRDPQRAVKHPACCWRVDFEFRMENTPLSSPRRRARWLFWGAGGGLGALSPPGSRARAFTFCLVRARHCRSWCG